MFDSVAITGLTSALQGLQQRQDAIADNIANVNTPNYRAKVVSFETALQQSIAAGNGAATATTTESSAATNVNGNNVDINQETLNNIDTVLMYQFASRAVGADFSAAETAMKTD